MAAEHDLIIISDEIYRDLVHDPATPVLSPAAVAPERTVVTTALSKSLALGGWRIGVARLPEGPLGGWLRGQLLGIGSEIWSAPAAPIQQAAALAFSEPDELRAGTPPAGRLHASGLPRRGRPVPGRRARRPAAAGRVLRLPGLRAVARAPGPPPRRDHRRGPGRAAAGPLRRRDPAGQRVRRAAARRCGCGWPPGSLYGETDEQQEAALAAPDPLALPWIAAELARLGEILADLAP